MSFFDDDDPPTRPARPRRPTQPRPRPAGSTSRTRAAGGAAASGDSQQLMVRRAVALGAGALILILLVVGVKGCLSSRTDNALKDYNRNVGNIVTDSNDQVSKKLFDLLAGGQTTQPIELQQNVNQVRVTADEDVKRARALDVPGSMQDAQRALLEVLTLRSGAIQRIADELPSLSGTQAEAAADRIAGQMSALLASDVVYSQRVIPYIEQAFSDRGISGQEIRPSRSFPDTQWLDPGFVRKELTGKGSGTRPGTVAPGTHGHGLVSVGVGTTTLQPGTALNRVPAGSRPTFTVTYQNQGENDEFDVGVRVTIRGSGKPITVTKRIAQTTKGSGNLEAQVPLGTAPPIGVPVRVTVSVLPVPGEVNTQNNSNTFTVIFTR